MKGLEIALPMFILIVFPQPFHSSQSNNLLFDSIAVDPQYHFDTLSEFTIIANTTGIITCIS